MILDKETNFRVLILANPTSKFLPKLELSAASLVLRLIQVTPFTPFVAQTVDT